MGNTIQEFNGARESFYDLDLLLIMRMIVCKARSNKGSISLAHACDVWEKACDLHAPGVIELRLEETLDDVGKVCEMCHAIREVRLELCKSLPTLNARILNTQFAVPRVRFADYSRDRVLLSLDRLESLIRAQADPCPSRIARDSPRDGSGA